MVTIQLLVRNNESIIERCLQSLPLEKTKLLVGDLGSTDATIKICKKYTKDIVNVSEMKDRSISRKKLIELSQTDWNFVLNPWEIFFSGHEFLSNLKNKTSNLKVSIVQGDVLTEETRIINKRNKFDIANRVFETIESKGDLSQIYLASSGIDDLSHHLMIAENWRNSDPLSLEPIYYLACLNLTLKNWDNFINYGNLYVTKQRSSSISKIMTHYYLAMVLLYIKKDCQESIKNLTFCLAKRPMMAEFWCLLGDIFYFSNDYKRAKAFFNAALLLGGQRINHDDWPVEISKYKSYPEKMILGCQKLLESSITYFPNK